MAFCTKCGSQQADGTAHCTACGAPMGAPAVATPATPQYAPPAAPPYAAPPVTPQYAPPMYQQAPMAPAQPNQAVQMFNSLDLGEKIAGVGGVVAAISFFLPWIQAAGLSFNGVDVASKGSASIWIMFLLPLVGAGLVYFAMGKDLRSRILVAGAQCLIGGTMLMSLLGAGQLGSIGLGIGWTFGWYGVNFGVIAVGVGGFMTLLESTKRLAGVH